MIYFDNAATTPLAPEVIDAMLKVMKDNFGNPSSVHAFGREARVLIEDARRIVASNLNVSPSEIFFTSCGTEAINMVIEGSVNDLGIKHIITSPIEHHAVLHTVEKLAHQGKCKVSFLKVDTSGSIDLSELENTLVTNEHTLVCLMYANNEIGTILPLKEVGEICERNNALFLCDTVQTMGKLSIDAVNSKMHFAVCSAHKFHGPKGIGFLYLNGNVKINPLLQGGGQERNMRSGTENIYGIVGLAKAFELAHKNMLVDVEYIKGLKKYFAERLKEEIKDIQFNGECDIKGLHTVLNVSFPKTKNAEMLLYNLDIEGIAASGGSACASGSVSESHVLKAIGADLSRTSIRFSFSKFNTKEEIDKCIDVIKKVLI